MTTWPCLTNEVSTEMTWASLSNWWVRGAARGIHGICPSATRSGHVLRQRGVKPQQAHLGYIIQESNVFIKPLSSSICPWRQFNLAYPDSYRVFTGANKIRLDCTRKELRGTPDIIKTQFIVGILKIIVYTLFIKKIFKSFQNVS